MRRIIAYFLVLFIFSLGYLHQKLGLYIEAYKLSGNHKVYNDFVDKRDALMYNLCNKTSLEKVNLWVKNNKFKLAGKEKILAFNIKNVESDREKIIPQSKIMAYIKHRLFKLPVGSEVLAKDKK